MFSMEGTILLTGASGMVGSAIHRLLEQRTEGQVLGDGHVHDCYMEDSVLKEIG